MWRGLSVLFGLVLGTAAVGQVYEWFDADGNRHFSDQKPDGVEYRVLGDPAANLSSYRPTEIRQPHAAIDERFPDATSSTPSSRSATGSRAGSTAEELKAACAEYLARIDDIHDRLRSGYNEPTGNRLRAERSALRTAYRRDCN